MSSEDHSRRRYSSPLRAEQAAVTRRRVLDAAGRLFASEGYFTTSLTAIAREAGVAPDTVQANGAKRDLLLAALEIALVGEETEDPIGDAPASLSPLFAVRDLEAFISTWADVVAATNERASRLWRAFRAAATSDPETRAVLGPLRERGRRDYRGFVEMLVERGAAIPVERRAALADEFAYLFDPEGYAHFVEESGWSRAQYREWLERRLTSLLAMPA